MSKHPTRQDRAREQGFQLRCQMRSLEALRVHDFRKAALSYVSFEAERPAPRAIGIDWKHYPFLEDDVSYLTFVFAGKPKCLNGTSRGHLEELRIVTAMKYLWGDKHLSDWLDNGLSEMPADHVVKKVSQLGTYAHHRATIAKMRREGMFRYVLYHQSRDSNVCTACRALAVGKFRLEAAPELPHAGCTSQGGCRCWITPAA